MWQLQPSGVVFDGHVDTDGNLYWRECGTASSQGPDCSVVSVDRDGRPRWRRNVGVTYGAPILVEGKLVLIAQNQPADACAQALLQARSTADGGVLWSRDLVALMGAQTFPNQCPAFLGTVPAAGPRPGTVVAGADAFTPWLTTVGTYARYFTISLADGTALEVSAIQTTSPGGGPAIHLDEAGNAYSDNILHTLSRSPDGTVRWDVIRDYVGFVTAAWSGTVALTGLDGLALMRGADGSTFAQVADSGPPVLDATGVTWIARRAGHATAIAVDPATGAERWSHPLDPGAEFVSGDSTHTLFFTELVATNAGTHLVVTQRATSTGAKAQLVRTYEAPVVRELDRDGNEVAATPLAGSGALGERIALRDGRLTLYFLDGSAVSLRTYDVPGRTIASSGWASEFGNMERNLHAQ